MKLIKSNYVLIFLAIFIIYSKTQNLAFSGHMNSFNTFDKNKLTKSLDLALKTAVDEQRIVGAVLLVSYKGSLVYEQAVGFADRELKIKTELNTIFRLASLSKIYTSLAVMKLVENNYLKTSDSIAILTPNIVPNLSKSLGKITIKQLLNHTSGLGYGFTDKKNIYKSLGIPTGLELSDVSLREAINRLFSAPLLFEPGTSWEYSLSTDVLGRIIELVYGKDLPTAMEEILLKPLNISDSYYVVPSQKKHRVAAAYKNAKPKPVLIDKKEFVISNKFMNLTFASDRIFLSDQYPSAGAGMAGTAYDVLKLLQVLQNQTSFLKKSTIDEMIKNSTGRLKVSSGTGYSYVGEVVLDSIKANTILPKGVVNWGGVYGSSWFVDPANQISMVLLTNSAFEGLNGKVVKDIQSAIYKNLPVVDK